MMLLGVHDPDEYRLPALTRTLREDLPELGKNARAMYCVVFVGSTEKTTLLLRVVQDRSWAGT
jgi:hypothetical protein